MRLMRGVQGRAPGAAGAVTIGNFDGVHRGHQHVFHQLADAAAAQRLRTTAVLFEPQPQEYFRPGSLARLTTFREKLQALVPEPVDQVLCLPFGAALAQMEPQEFVERVLVLRLGTRHLVVGEDFRFGRGRQGDFATLQRAGRSAGFTVESAATFVLDGERVSSTRIRSLLAQGEVTRAARLLGRPYSMTGRVLAGDKRGRTLGAPTANIALAGRLLPLTGVYVCRVFGPAGVIGMGVANAGTRPTVDGIHASLEVHVLDWARDLYGQRLRVEFLQRLRLERRFASLEELKQQIRVDIAAARSWLAAHSGGLEHIHD